MALAGLLLLVIGSGTALANGGVRINTTRTVATSTNSSLFVLRTDGRQAIATCRSFTITANITSAGVVSIPRGNVVFTNCLVNGIAATITQTRDWSGSIISLLTTDRRSFTGILLGVVIPTGGVTFSAPLIGCNFTLGGAAGALASVGTVALGTLVTVPSITFTTPGLPALGLRVDTGASCAAAGIVAGNTGGFSGLFNFAPGVNGTGV
ncbi:hypothetical protein [Conexibacter sp. CPCC 206217]|uniref:hypothetical protein n=1 Tax=Conexibacter sp. CPCC 206217 TaxID=3064574 RepID=UPI00271CB3F0|nr:hypothetical protein [Conexibacter sp. CPCC 206217]MDO8209889.1 hypothetical protein [Conexibacter sp. CPCC 206217]